MFFWKAVAVAPDLVKMATPFPYSLALIKSTAPSKVSTAGDIRVSITSSRYAQEYEPGFKGSVRHVFGLEAYHTPSETT